MGIALLVACEGPPPIELEVARELSTRDPDAVIAAYEALEGKGAPFTWEDREQLGRAYCLRGAAATDEDRALADLKRGAGFGMCDTKEEARLREILRKRAIPALTVPGL
ncbi:MAG: hypothetical protein ACOZNI_05980 [Myxococcota bacterium]